MSYRLSLATAASTLMLALAGAHAHPIAVPDSGNPAATPILRIADAPAAAPADQTGPVRIDNAFARATAGTAKISAVYLTLTSSADDALLSASTPAAGKVQLHQHTMDGGVMKMRPVDKIALPAGTAVDLKPGGYHIMLMDLPGPLAAGTMIPVTLTFAKAPPLTISVPVNEAGAEGHHHDHMGGMGNMPHS